jgi:Tfp pilus assembly protein PilZ
MITYNKILENRHQHMEFSARVAGVEIKKSSSNPSGIAPQSNQMVENLRKARDSKLESGIKQKKPTSFSDGVGYGII